MLLLVCLNGHIAAAGESRPPLLEAGEFFPDYPTLIANISRFSPVYTVAFSPDGQTLGSESLDGVRLVDPFSHQLLWVVVGGRQRGAWLACKENGQCWRYDDGTLLVRYEEEQKRLAPVPPPLPKEAASVEILSAPAALTSGALESEACRDLITKPMAALNIRYESEALVEHIALESGRRANLIAIICNEILKGIDIRSRVIRSADIERAMDSAGLRDALAGWGGLAGEEQGSRLDRIIVYATVDRETFTLAELIQILDDHGCSYSPDRLRESLARLELAFILGREQNRYDFRVPLFQKMIRSEEPEVFLRREIQGMMKISG